MAKHSGIIVRFDESRRNDLLDERIEQDTSFSDALSVYDWELKNISVALLAFSDTTLDFICLARKGKRVVTSKNRVEFSSLVSLGGLSLSEIEAHLDSQLSNYFIRSSQGAGGKVPEATWAATLNAIRQLRPNVTDEIDRLETLTKYAGVRLTGSRTEILAQEREALGVSLDIFSGGSALRNQVLTQWAPKDEEVTGLDEGKQEASIQETEASLPSFLQGLPERYRQEESALQHDLMNWNGATSVSIEGVSSFEQGSRKLSVVYANRNSLETTLGVDLIYFNEAFNQFVLVQYKLMREESGQQVYRPDDQFREELSRMDAFNSRYVDGESPTKDSEIRLNADGFFFKLVPNRGLVAASGELSRGMYLPREYVHFLVGPHGPVGSRGGCVVNFENATRYLSNSEFISNVRLGRIGTYGSVSTLISNVIRAYYETGRGVVIAHETDTNVS